MRGANEKFVKGVGDRVRRFEDQPLSVIRSDLLGLLGLVMEMDAEIRMHEHRLLTSGASAGSQEAER